MFWSLHRLFNSFSYDFNQNHTKSYTLNKRRELKYDIKLKYDMISIYIDWRHDISKLYKQRINGILRDYERFSPFLKPEELQSYLNFKFSSDAEFKNKWKITKKSYSKYKNVLIKFLKSAYNLSDNFFNGIYSDKPYRNPISEKKSMSAQDVARVFKELVMHKLYDDAFLLQLMYSLSLSPETLEMLIYENVDMDGYLTYRDESSNKPCKIRLDDDIIMTVNFLFDHKGDNHSNHVKRKRVSRYGYIENGIFITKYRSSQIYKKFSNQFGGKIKWLCATPNQIVNINKRKIHRRKICKQSIPIPELI